MSEWLRAWEKLGYGGFDQWSICWVGDENDKRNDEKECKNGNDGDGDNEGGNDDDAFTFTTSTLPSSYYL